MNKVKIALLALFAGMSTHVVKAEEVTEDFESVTIVDADGNAVSSSSFGVGLSNGWKIVGGQIYSDDYSSNYGFSSTAKTGSKALVGVPESNSAIFVIPVPVSGTISFYARQVGSSSSTKAYVDLFEMEQDGSTFKAKSSTSFKYWRMTSTYTKYEYNLGETPKYIGIRLQKTLLDDVTYNTISLEPHEHSYATEWSNDADGHWYACTSETGYCDTPKSDYAAHDGLTCSVCGYKTPGIEAYPWLEDFNSITSGIPTGWDNSEGTTTTDSYKWNYYSKGVRFDSYNNSSNKTNVLATPLLYIPSTGVYELKFKVKNPKGGNYEVKIAEYGSAERTTLLDNLTNIASWTEKTVDLSAYAGRAVKIYFCGTSNWGSGDAYLYLDDVTVKESIQHNHDYADAWSHDYTCHWHECTSVVGECDALKADVAAHTFDAEGICTVCGYDQPYMEDFENGIPESWNNGSWQLKNGPTSANGSQMAYSYRSTASLVTPLLQAKAGDEIQFDLLQVWEDEAFTVEYCINEADEWNEALSVKAGAMNQINKYTTYSWTAPADGNYRLRFTGMYYYLDNICGFKLAEITLSETAETFDAIEKEYGKVTVNRTVKADTWNTFCVPFAMTAEEIETNLGADAQVKELTGVTVDGTSFGMTFGDAASIEAGKPYMVKVANAVNKITVYNKTITSTLHDITVEDGSNSLTFCGNLAKMNAPMDSYIISSNKFYVVNSEVTLKGFRGYFTTNAGAGAKLMELNLDDDATAIQSIDSQVQKQVYDLSGRRVSNAQKGIYIINNKKVVK